jgi:hypothetical protein
MQVTIQLFLMVLALVLLLLAGLNVPSHPRINLGWFGLFFWLLAIVLR